MKNISIKLSSLATYVAKYLLPISFSKVVPLKILQMEFAFKDTRKAFDYFKYKQKRVSSNALKVYMIYNIS